MKNIIFCPRCHCEATKAGWQKYVVSNRIVEKQRYKCKSKPCSHYFTLSDRRR